MPLNVDLLPWPGQKRHPPLTYVVIMARFRDQWLLVRHHERTTLEIPGGKIEAGETPLQAARRELYEETGASDFHLSPMELYRVSQPDQPNAAVYGLLCLAQIDRLERLPPDSEIADTILIRQCPAPDELTWPQIQPVLFAHAERRCRLLNRLQQYDHVIWDWNGTLVDDSPLAVDIVNALLAEHQLPATTLNQYREQFCHPIIDYYAGLGIDFQRLPFDQLCERFVRHYAARRDALALHPGSRFLLHSLSGRCRQSLLSASSQKSLERCIAHHELADYFHHLFGLDNTLAHSKVARGRELLRHSGIAARRTILVGDTDHDLEVAEALGTRLILIASGHQSYRRLSALHDEVLPDWTHAA